MHRVLAFALGIQPRMTCVHLSSALVFQYHLDSSHPTVCMTSHTTRNLNDSRGRVGLDSLEESVPVVEHERASENEFDGAIQSTTWIPSAALLHIVERHLYQIVTRVEQRGSVDSESIVTISPSTGDVSIDAHRRFTHGTIEDQQCRSRFLIERYGGAIIPPPDPGQGS